MAVDPSGLPEDMIVIARDMGPAELLDYDRARLRGLVLEEGSALSHVAIGRAVLHEPRIVIQRVVAEDSAAEQIRFDEALAAVRAARDRKSTRLNSSHIEPSRMPSSA